MRTDENMRGKSMTLVFHISYCFRAGFISHGLAKNKLFCTMVGQAKILQFFTPNRGTSKRCGDNFGPVSNDQEEKPAEESCQTPPLKKAKLASGLSAQQLERIETNRLNALIRRASKAAPALHTSIGLSWFKALEVEFSKPYFIKLSEFLVEERKNHTIFPAEDDVYSWTKMTNIQEVKVVILGQDPYHGPNQAHGLCFSVQKGIPPPPSLINMYKELERDIPGFKIPQHGNLTDWAKQGVLMLNACLTVRAHNANSHKDKGWEMFTDAVIAWINANLEGVVFLLWGSYAQKKASFISKSRHHVLCCAHPSPLSVHRGFIGCQHFSKTNELLRTRGKTPIDWSDLFE